MDHYIIRQVKKEDSRRVWEIRNHPIARKYSCHSELIPLESHEPWFENKYFLDSINYCFVLEIPPKLVIGYCRFDYDENKDSYIISLALDPAYHGRGLGHKLLADSLAQLKATKSILAEIKKVNVPSVGLFKKNKFKVYKEDDENYYLILNPYYG